MISIKLRNIIFKVHLWAGLSAGLLIALVGISGSALVFRADIERFETRQWQTVPVSSENRLPLDILIAQAITATPSKVLARVLLPSQAEGALQVIVQKPRARSLKDSQLEVVFVDPYRGSILGVRDYRSGPIGALQDFHFAFLAGDLGLKINGVVALILLALALTGPFLWWPGVKHWRSGFKVRALPARLKWRDLHALSGVIGAVVLIIISLTGVYYAYRSTAAAVVTLASGNAALALPTVVKPSRTELTLAQPVGLEQLWVAARRALPLAELDELRPPRGASSPVSISFRDAGDFVFGRNRLYVNPYDATVLRIDRFAEQGFAARLLGNMGPWHFGIFGGRLTQWLWFFAGLLPIFLFGSGFWLWWRNRR